MEYQAGTFLYKLGKVGILNEAQRVFIHDGHTTGDGYGVVIGFTSDDAELRKSTGYGNYCYGGDVRLAEPEEIKNFITAVHNYDKPIKTY